jgi:hypothetical protein
MRWQTLAWVAALSLGPAYCIWAGADDATPSQTPPKALAGKSLAFACPAGLLQVRVAAGGDSVTVIVPPVDRRPAWTASLGFVETSAEGHVFAGLPPQDGVRLTLPRNTASASIAGTPLTLDTGPDSGVCARR